MCPSQNTSKRRELRRRDPVQAMSVRPPTSLGAIPPHPPQIGKYSPQMPTLDCLHTPAQVMPPLGRGHCIAALLPVRAQRSSVVYVSDSSDECFLGLSTGTVRMVKGHSCWRKVTGIFVSEMPWHSGDDAITYTQPERPSTLTLTAAYSRSRNRARFANPCFGFFFFDFCSIVEINY